MEVIYRNSQGIGMRDKKGGACGQNEKCIKGLLRLWAISWSEQLSFSQLLMFICVFSAWMAFPWLLNKGCMIENLDC